ncbi:MAG: hypothetical protein K6G90_02390, partial [Clostridia bacterium]|nr:hypothetical protein [Clostridia bacterium]
MRSDSEIRQLVNVIARSDELIGAAATIDEAQRVITEKNAEATDAAAGARASENAAADALETVIAREQEISQIALTSDTIARQALERATNAENESAVTGSTVDGLGRDLARLSTVTQGKIDDAYVDDGFLYMTSDGDIVAGPLGPFSGGGGGGGGGSGNNAHITLTNRSGFLSRTIAQGDTLPLSVNWSSEEDGIPTGNGTMKITVGGVVKAVLDVQQGDVTVDVAPYLTAGSSAVKINVADTYGNNRTLNFSITVVVLTLTSSFDDSTAYTGPVSFPYVPTGNIEKTVHFILDGSEIGTAVTSVSGRQQSFTIPQQTHGAHVFTCRFEAEINGQTVRSNELYYEIICLEPMNMTPVVTCDFHETSVKQYTTIHIGFSVYDPSSMNADVTISRNGTVISEQTVGRSRQDFSVRMDTADDFTFAVASGNVSRSFTLTVTESDIDIEAETEALALYLTSTGRSNSEETRSVW